jgi:hypothetical protein
METPEASNSNSHGYVHGQHGVKNATPEVLKKSNGTGKFIQPPAGVVNTNIHITPYVTGAI